MNAPVSPSVLIPALAAYLLRRMQEGGDIHPVEAPPGFRYRWLWAWVNPGNPADCGVYGQGPGGYRALGPEGCRELFRLLPPEEQAAIAAEAIMLAVAR